MKTKNILLLLIIFCFATSFIDYNHEVNKNNHVKQLSLNVIKIEFDTAKFYPFPRYKYGEASIIDNIIPDDSYIYWECIFKGDAIFSKDRGKVIVYNGDSLNYASKINNIDSPSGFFESCEPNICFYYIVAVDSKRKIHIINSNEKLKSFIGHIDNVEEVILLSKINGYSYDESIKIGGAYRERENYFLLYLLEYSSSPVTFKSVRAILNKNGKFRVFDKTIYKENKDEYIFP